MPRRPDGREPRTVTIHVRLTPAGTNALDTARGSQTRSQFIRALIAAAVTRSSR